MEWLSVTETANKWNISVRSVQRLCREGRIAGAQRWGHSWMIPADSGRPGDLRKTRYINDTTPIPELRLPGQNPLLFLPNAPQFLADNPPANALAEAWMHYFQGDIPASLKIAEPLRKYSADFCGTLSLGMLLAACALSQGNAVLWAEGRSRILSAICTSESEKRLRQLCLATTDEGLMDNSQLPDWLHRGEFELLPADSLPIAWFYYAKHLYISARNTAMGKVSHPDVAGLGLMRTLPFIMEPIIAQAKIENLTYTETSLRGLCAKVYYDLGDYARAEKHIDITLKLLLSLRLYGMMAELRSMLGTFFDDRLECLDAAAVLKIKALHKEIMEGYAKINYILKNTQISTSLTAREHEVAQLAALGFSNVEIAQRLKLSVSSVKAIVSVIMNKTGAQKRSEFFEHLL